MYTTQKEKRNSIVFFCYAARHATHALVLLPLIQALRNKRSVSESGLGYKLEHCMNWQHKKARLWVYSQGESERKTERERARETSSQRMHFRPHLTAHSLVNILSASINSKQFINPFLHYIIWHQLNFTVSLKCFLIRLGRLDKMAHSSIN